MCFSVTHREFDEMTRRSHAVRAEDPSIQTIVGGAQPTYRSADFLDNIPVLPYEKLDRRYFEIDLRMIRGLPLRGAIFVTTRSCPFSWSYCGCNLIFGRRSRSYSLAHIEAEVRCLKERHGAEGIWIGDDTFTVRREHALGVAAILERPGLIWGCQTRVNTIDEGMLRAMKDAGCV